VVLKDVNLGPNKFRVVEIAVSLAMEKHDAQRELVSRLLLFLVNHDVLSIDDVVKAFEHLLNNLADITLDTPNAPTVGSKNDHYCEL
jgi:programmed cell death protein 4